MKINSPQPQPESLPELTIDELCDLILWEESLNNESETN